MNQSETTKHDHIRFQSLHILKERISDGSFSELLDDWKWIFGYSKKYTKEILIYLILGILSTCLGLAGSISSKYILDIITGYQTNRLSLLLIMMVTALLLSLLFDSLTKRITARLSLHIHNDIQADVFDAILDADWISLNKFSNGDLLNRFNSDISTVSSNAVSWLPTLIISLFRFAVTFAVIWYYNPVMALIALASAPFLLFFSRYILKKQQTYHRRTKEMGSRLMTFESESFYNLDTIKSFSASRFYSCKMRNLQESYKKICLEHNHFMIQTHILMTVLNTIVQLTAFGYCLFLLWNHSITYGTMTLFLQQRNNLSTAFQNMVSIIPAFLNSAVSAHRLQELTTLPRELHLPPDANFDCIPSQGITLEIKNADFSYSSNMPVIQNSSIHAGPGEIIALAGSSGTGKTTLIRLILGLIHPQKGTVSLKNADGHYVNISSDTRCFLAYVPQGNTLIRGTIAENLRITKENASDEELIEALKTACAWEFVQKMPDSLNTVIGEHGHGISEGQAQRISIARAILRNSPILLLDEATSALDADTERQVLLNILKHTPGKTCIITTHRPSVLKLCKRIYRIMDQQITELTAEDFYKTTTEF